MDKFKYNLSKFIATNILGKASHRPFASHHKHSCQLLVVLRLPWVLERNGSEWKVSVEGTSYTSMDLNLAICGCLYLLQTGLDDLSGLEED